MIDLHKLVSECESVSELMSKNVNRLATCNALISDVSENAYNLHINSYTNPLTHSLTHSLTQSLTQSLTHALTD